MKTIFCDIDGTLCLHHEDIVRQHKEGLTLLPNTLEVLSEWEKKFTTTKLFRFFMKIRKH